MVLSWEDVVNKEFQLTKFREGYDRDEVEDFLDEVVEELKRLTAENAQLQADLDACRGGTPAAPAPDVSTVSTPEADVATPQPATPVAAATTPPQPAAAADSGASAAGVLAMAQRLHDEFVAEGEQKRDALVADAQTRADAVVQEAEQQRQQTLAALATEKSSLEQEVTRLREFETDYRTRLTSYIEGQLQELTTRERVEPAQGTV